MSAHHPGPTWLDHHLAITFFKHYAAGEKHEEPYTLRSLAPRINVQTATKKEKLPWLKLAKFGEIKTTNGSLRHNDNVLALSGVEADYDAEHMTVAEAVDRLDKAGVLAMVYTSPSHTEDAPRWRVLCPFSGELPPSRRDAMLGRLNGLFGGVFSGESWTLSQSYYYGSVNHNPSHQVELIDGSPLDQHDELDEIWQGKPDDKGTPAKLNGNGVHQTSRHGLTANIFDLALAIRDIPNEGGADWESWNRRGMMFWAATSGSEAGRDLWHAWSARNETYDRDEANVRWDHYGTSPPTSIGAGAIFHEAKASRERAIPVPNEADYGTPLSSQETGHPSEKNVPPAGHVPHSDGDTLFKLTWFEQIQSVSDAQDFVQGVLTSRSASVVYGESNAGKTFWATDLALHVAAGKSWNKNRVEKGAVIYCVLEGSMGFRNRVAAWRDAFADGEDVLFASIESGINLLNPDADTPKLINTIRHAAATLDVNVALVVIDTLSRALAGGNENSPEDMGSLVVNMDNIRAATGAHVMFIHHSGKDAAKGARGHSLLRAAVDTEIEVIAEEGTARKTATTVKQRELAKGVVFEFSLSVVTIGKNRYGEEVTTCLVQPSGNENATPASRKMSGDISRALELLTDILASAGQTGHSGTPLDTASVPEQWWRERFYDSAKAGAEEEAKRKAFRRAADALVEKHIVGMGNRRVWLVRKQQVATNATSDMNVESEH